MATVLNTTFKLKRGSAERWAEVNPILAQGEPGFVLDENRFKIGDGVTPWNELPYIGESNIFSGATKEDFPKEGYSWVILPKRIFVLHYQRNQQFAKLLYFFR